MVQSMTARSRRVFFIRIGCEDETGVRIGIYVQQILFHDAI